MTWTFILETLFVFWRKLILSGTEENVGIAQGYFLPTLLKWLYVYIQFEYIAT